jgi:hypothetical protein
MVQHRKKFFWREQSKIHIVGVGSSHCSQKLREVRVFPGMNHKNGYEQKDFLKTEQSPPLQKGNKRMSGTIKPEQRIGWYYILKRRFREK